MSERIEEDGYITIRRSGKDKLSNHIEVKKDNWSVDSKKKLKVSMRHKMKRIFASILDALDIERESGNIITDDKAFKKIRSQILNIGNDQIRCMELELDERFNVEALNYHIEFRVIGQDGTV